MLIHAAVDNDIYPPRFGGPQRSFGLFRGLARRHEVRVLSLVPNRTDAPREQQIAGVTLLRRKAWYTSLAWRLGLLGLAPLESAADLHAWRARTLLGALPARPDVLAVEFPMTGLLRASRAPLKVYMSQNVEADFFAATAPRLLARGAWCAHIRARERAAVEGADLTVVTSDEDAARTIALYGAPPSRLEVVPNGYDELAVRPPEPGERAAARTALGLSVGDYAALFVGSDFLHNRDACRLLVERVGPALPEGLVLILAGGASRAFAGRREPWLRVLGPVDDLLPVLHAADAGLNPVVRGGGSNVKVPTYLAAGMAVISSRFGLRGYATLASAVTIAEPDALGDALETRPRGWAARGERLPAAAAELAWGRLGERLGESWAARRASPTAAASAGEAHPTRRATA